MESCTKFNIYNYLKLTVSIINHSTKTSTQKSTNNKTHVKAETIYFFI